MKRIIVAIASILVAGLALTVLTQAHAAGTCTPVPTTSKGPLTAAIVATSNQTINTDVDATGCDIGVYIGSGVTGVTISTSVHDANQYGVFNDGGSATVDSSHVYKTGNHTGTTFTPNGVQTGVDIYYTNGATGAITNNTVDEYQKGGIVVNGAGTVATVTGNTVTGLGPVDFIAQNGIQVSRGAGGVVRGNIISNNFYTGEVGVGPNPGGQNPEGFEYTSGGLLLYQAGNVQQSQNHFSGNQRNLEMVP
jgi:hypothetical protein